MLRDAGGAGDRHGGRALGSMVLMGSVLIMAGLIALLLREGRAPSGQATGAGLVVYCAAGIKPPVEAAAREYERLYGRSIQLQYGGSGTLLSNLRAARTGDLYLAADQSHIDLARQQGLIQETLPLARLRPVIVVARGNPKQVLGLSDLLRADVRVSLANPEAASIGSVTRAALEKTGQWAGLDGRVRAGGVFKPTVNDVANDVKLGAADAGIVWDATGRQYPELEAVEAGGGLAEAEEPISIAVLSSSTRPTEALRFARFLAARDRGLVQFAHFGYTIAEGDDWAAAPELRLYSGAMLRPAIEQTLREFEQREGVRLTTVYNGCGILTAQMRAGERPDAYFACDRSFMNTVADLYLAPQAVAENDLMIIVPKGKERELATVQALAGSGVRVGLAHPEKSAMGALTRNLLVAMGLYDAVKKNTTVESATGDLLVNQLRAGSLDAVIACRSNAVAGGRDLEAISIDHPLARAIQPYAVGKQSRHRQTMTRLLAAIESAESKQRFESAGFGVVPERPVVPERSILPGQ